MSTTASTGLSSQGLSASGTRRKPRQSDKKSPRRAPPPSKRAEERDGGLGWTSPHAVAGLLCGLAIAFGWSQRHELDIVASDGLGYALGIGGLAMMVLLLGYSVRKRVRTLRNAGPMRTWFEIHLVLGLVGPTMILYHSNFGLGSANSTISLVCVLAVSGSGIGGRFLYGKMHRGLAGERRSTTDLRKRARAALDPIEALLLRSPKTSRQIADFEVGVVDSTAGLIRSLSALALRPKILVARRGILRSLRQEHPNLAIDAGIKSAFRDFFALYRRAGELILFERLFALWHAIHIPLTVILFVSAALHVVAVHLY